MLMDTLPILLLHLFLPFLASRVDGTVFSLDLHHRFSNKVRLWAESMSLDSMGWPREQTPEYYAALAAHDRALHHRRGLLGVPQNLTFAGGNNTRSMGGIFGSLHYAEVELGTPKVKFLVALDTGSDLLWVPCDCTNCAPTYDKEYNISFNIFNSNKSSTVKRVPCSSNLCELQSSCSAPTSTCPYKVRYVDNSSTSGVLLEDVMYFITDDARRKAVQAKVTFGCGQDQSGGSTAVPNGLLGLGMERISVPSTLTAAALTTNSFSMCFSDDLSGRIRFGDSGSPDQYTTPFYPNIPMYVVTVTGIYVDNQSCNGGIHAYFDTGSSYTLLADPIYTSLATAFNEFVQRRRVTFGADFPFDYCYEIGSNEKEILIPTLSLTMEGGKDFDVSEPIVGIADSSTGNLVAFCLAIIKDSKLNIIGQNFMTGYKIVFDRDNLVLGWKEFDCYKSQGLNTTAPTHSSTVADSPKAAPAPASQSQSPQTPPGSTKKGNSASLPLPQSLLFSVAISQLSLLLLFAV